MAKADPDVAVTPTLLDRLIDLEPKVAADPPASRSQSVRQLKASLRRDLEWLLNTRRIPDEAPETYRELHRSLYNFGLPDVTSMSLNSPRDRQRLLRLVEQTIAIFEPRLTAVRVRAVDSAASGPQGAAVSDRGASENGPRAGTGAVRHLAATEQRGVPGEGRIACATNCCSTMNASSRSCGRWASQFADKYPKIASRLSLEPDKCEDPHVERLLEAFAFLAARVHLKIDDEFPEITEALLSIIYPHFIRPVPSMTIADFRVNPEQGQIGGGLKIPRGSVLSSRPVGGVPCKFRTCYDTYVWPLSVVAAEWKTPDRLQPAIKAPEAAAALRVELKCWPDITFEKLHPNPLRFFLNGESGLIHTLYELLCSRLHADPGARPDSGLARAAGRAPPRGAPPGGVRRG